MRWKSGKQKYREWTEWFAWHPVTIVSGDIIWLEKIYRKYTSYQQKDAYVYNDDFGLLKALEYKESPFETSNAALVNYGIKHY